MGILLFFNGVFMLIASLVSLIYKDGVTFEITISSFIVLFIGALLMLFLDIMINKFKNEKVI